MVDIHSAKAEIRRSIKKEERKKERKKEQTTGRKYNVRICYAGRHKNSNEIFFIELINLNSHIGKKCVSTPTYSLHMSMF